ncbi:hypothetical protein [Oceanicoccus sagamiensis]|uniref:Uncharacterized protein n=1 Tax=Oceanicoccus sagamiensis TaxID=716816 RepID=A0A1X9NCY4_9GAMM|nr:hypothetical protein [Oceanicoccus sagamiensis]ARN73765.1 hypothetical protein BST96_06340 [Oceanicoccus sagamiensis]
MKTGKAIGLILSSVGILAGVYLGVSPVIDALSTQYISGHTAGVYLANIGILAGLSCAAIGIIFNRTTNNT